MTFQDVSINHFCFNNSVSSLYFNRSDVIFQVDSLLNLDFILKPD